MRPDVSAADVPAFVLPADKGHDGLLTDPRPMPRIPRLRLAGREKVHVLLQFNRPHPALPREGSAAANRVERRAMAIWPRLDQRALHRCHGDAARIAVQVSHRTPMTCKAIEKLIAD